ncbi:MAG TPA: nuclear transport factor 2 family protein [Candidatus Eisenbacteria bacterium]|nr:nuclear transport factor 2 family protein [Candidatus Eisenbacteria bacterium]
MTTSLKERAVSFLKLAAAGRLDEAYDLVGTGFLHHNPYFRGDAPSLKAAMAENAAQNPRKTLEVKRALEDDDLVAVHSHVRQKPEDPGAAVVHIFRFEKGRIVELWDVGQPVMDEGPNEHGMF